MPVFITIQKHAELSMRLVFLTLKFEKEAQSQELLMELRDWFTVK
jgi:hypothetical protein